MPLRVSARASATSPITSVRRTRPPAKLHRFQPGTRRRQRAMRSSAYFRNSGQSASASLNSPSSSGYFSTLKKSRLHRGEDEDEATSSNSCQAHKKLSPVPNPVSPMANPSPLDNDAKRSASRLPCRKTCRFSASPESLEK